MSGKRVVSMIGVRKSEQASTWGAVGRVMGSMGTLLLLCASLSSLALVSTAQASSAASGGLCTPAKRGVNLALPAVVRITTTYQAQLTYTTGDGSTVVFPQDGSAYTLTTTGAGAFISANGDVLTAYHVVNLPQDSLNPLLLQQAAPDIAQALNASNPSQTVTAADIYNQLINDPQIWQATYQQPQSALYLSSQYTGPASAGSLESLQRYPVTITAQSSPDQPQNTDLAILHVDGLHDLPTILLGDSNQVYQDDTLTILGYPGSADLPASDGSINPANFTTASVNTVTVSAFKTTDTGSQVIQVGGNVEQGDSGGPALDADGQLVGVVSFAASSSSDPIQTSFLHTVNDAKTLVRQAGVNLTQDAFDQRWAAAYDACSSTASGHWHDAYNQYTQMARLYPDFKGVQMYITYTKAQAAHEPLANQGMLPGWAIALIIALVLLVVALVFILLRRRRVRARAGGAAYAGYGPGLNKGYPVGTAGYSLGAPLLATQRPAPASASEQIGAAMPPRDASAPTLSDPLSGTPPDWFQPLSPDLASAPQPGSVPMQPALSPQDRK